MQHRLLSFAMLGLTLAVAGCGGINQEAGATLDGGTFGNATMNNHLVQTCQNVSNNKYSSGKCAPRTLDGKYARVTYDDYVRSAAEMPEIVPSFGGVTPGSANAGGS